MHFYEYVTKRACKLLHNVQGIDERRKWARYLLTARTSNVSSVRQRRRVTQTV
jgi:hypothetical protein